ncbi:HRDC domain-containing protein [Frigoribacterium sp. CFBP9039]|uniref:HRDC domain-containing protein n=1 Tax=unclassified Frigoribacterium TaxID=2627005 RepID=UPI002A6A95CC|nr:MULTISPECIES: HRDC domain-containing protein [unclassified Frigoribacterium]MDY0891099.1 HRDC domain-containing protein [Frigoribacterium sp. CFBP9030]MDY0944942.1 HRDC domain-containing protein [Frigoribacterium sp. CFBP9039]
MNPAASESRSVDSGVVGSAGDPSGGDQPVVSVSPSVLTTADDLHGRVDVIADRPGYLAAVEAIRSGTGPVSIDAERASGFRYSQRAYLIQVFRRGAGVFLFDPPAIGSFAELQEVIGHEEWVLHAASQDLACLREVGLDPATVFDTELGARIAGLPKVGLGAVVEQLLGVHLAKEHSAADWSTRPLPQSWLVYAALDVELLVDLRDAMEARLVDAGKLEIAREEFAATVAREAKPPKVDPWRRLTGLHTVRGTRGLAVARELWLARDEYARQIDTAPGRLVPDSSLVAATKAMPADKRALAGLREFVGRASRSELDRWWGAIERGLATTDLPSTRGPAAETLPPPRSWADKNPMADARYRFARPRIAEIAETFDMPVENLLTPEHLRRLAWEPPIPFETDAVAAALEALGARRWQIDAVAEPLAEAFVDAHQEPEDGDGATS